MLGRFRAGTLRAEEMAEPFDRLARLDLLLAGEATERCHAAVSVDEVLGWGPDAAAEFGRHVDDFFRGMIAQRLMGTDLRH